MEKYFFQDFLFREMPIKDDSPDVEIEYSNDISKCVDMLGDLTGNSQVAIGFSYLLEQEKETDWQKIVDTARRADTITIVDDIYLKNAELKEYKNFYLCAYYWYLSQYAKCFLYTKAKIQ